MTLVLAAKSFETNLPSWGRLHARVSGDRLMIGVEGDHVRALSSIFGSRGRPTSERLLRQTRLEQGCASGWLELAIVETARGFRLARVKTRHALIELTVEQFELLSMIVDDAGRMLGDPLAALERASVPDVFADRETQRNYSATP